MKNLLLPDVEEWWRGLRADSRHQKKRIDLSY
jgi:hypothetical protein